MSRDTAVRVGGGAVIVALLAATWWEILFLPLGASHDGRINARFGLHVRNLLESGWRGSDYLSSPAPFSEIPYTHHPPLLNLLHAAAGYVLGQGEWQLHLIGYASGLATVAGLVWLARELDLGGPVSVAVTALVSTTPMFWIYARLGLGVSLMVVLLALWSRHRRVGGRRRLLAAAAGLAALSSWMGAALVGLVSGWGALETRYRRSALLMGAAGVGAVALALLWAVGAGDVSELIDHAARRRRWPEWAAVVGNHRWFYGTLYPWWIRWLILPAIVVALVDGRTRIAAGAVVGSLAIWTLAVPNAAPVHDYWTYPLLVPVFLGLSAVLDRAGRWRWVLTGGLVAVLVAAGAGLGRLPPYRDAYFRAPSDAGALLRESPPADGQVTAWVAGGVDPVPRWVSYYWNLPVGVVTDGTTGLVAGTDLILVRLDRIPGWMVDTEVVAEKGLYALVRGL